MTAKQEVETTEVPIKTLAAMAFGVGSEVVDNDGYKTWIPDGGESDDVPSIYELENEWTFTESITDDEHGWGIVFGGDYKFPVSYRVSRGSRYHPPEYDTDYYNLGWTLVFFPGANGGYGYAEFVFGE